MLTTWCMNRMLLGAHCVVRIRGKDAHSNRGERSQRSDHSVISWDIGYCSRRDDEGDKLCVLFVRDSFTGLLGAIPTVQKGGRYLSSMTTEIVRFIVQIGHASVGLRCDAEPSTLTLLQAVSKTCQGLNIKTHKEPTLLETIKLMVVQRSRCGLLRSHASVLIGQIEEACGCKSQTVGCNHPLYAWALLHSAWVLNRFKVRTGMTPFEICSGRSYNGRLVLFGERVLAYLKSEKKAKPQWQTGLWLGKTIQR